MRSLMNNVINQINSTPAPATPTNLLQQGQTSNGSSPGFVDNADLGTIGDPGAQIGGSGNSGPGNQNDPFRNLRRRAGFQSWNLLG